MATAVADTRIADARLILKQVAERHGIEVRYLTGRSRMRGIVDARVEAAKLLHFELNLPLKAVGRLLGSRHHTTILYYLRYRTSQ